MGNKTIIRAIKLVGFISLFAALAACENTVKHISMTVDTNAYYSAYQRKPADEWRPLDYGNSRYDIRTLTFNVENENTPYSLVFVCPSSRGDLPHEVYVYYSTAKEMNLIDFKCRRAAVDIITKPLYGKVLGVNTADSINTQGEFVHLGLSRDVSLNVHEAYAAIVASGQRDIVGYKGKQAIDSNIVQSPEKFIIQRGISLALTEKPQEVDVDFSGDSSTFYTKDFNPTSISTVSISGLAENEQLSAKVGFLSEKKTYLELASSKASSFSFLPVPLTNAEDVDDASFSNFNLGEGHELEVNVLDDEGKVSRQARKFFTESNSEVHEMRLPPVISNTPALSLQNQGDLQQISASWKQYQTGDDELSAKLYRWELTGIAAPYLETEKPATIVGAVKWIISITPGWLEGSSNSGGSYAMRLPTDFDTDVFGPQGDKFYVWRKEWGFRASSPVDWEMSAISVSDNANSQDVVDYTLNRNFVRNFSYGQVYLRDSITP